MKREELRIRDPFIYADKKTGWYYMYGTTALCTDDSFDTACTFGVYKSRDLENFEYKEIFNGQKTGFWGTRDYWASEMHEYKGKYYLFGTVKSENRHRGTQIFVCDTPDGEFVPVSDKPATPEEWECLDGTLYVEDGVPYIVFCHEWAQCKNGEICAQRLSDDLTTPVGEPFLLFKATDNPRVTEVCGKGSGNFVTDGPFLWKEDGKVKMIWSSFSQGQYAVFGAYANDLHGAWTHTDDLFDFDGGHAMLFETFDGKRKISLHAPNALLKERAEFLDVNIQF